MAVIVGSTSARAANRPDSSGNVYIQNLLQEAGGLAWDSYANGTETITINEGVNLIVDPASAGWRAMTRGPGQIVINNGKLLIRNTSTSTGLRFLKARSSTTVTNTYILPYGLGTVEIQGNWIELGVSTGAANQTFTHWCTDYLPAVEVETAPGSGIYEWWYNIGHMTDIGLIDGVTGGFLGYNGKASLPSDAKFFEQASMIASEWLITMTMDQQWKSTLRFYDGENGAIPPAGCKIRVPNIVLADVTQAQHLIAAERDNCCRIDTSNGGAVVVDKAIFSSSLLYANQSVKLDIRNACFAIAPFLSECYDVYIDNIHFNSSPIYLYGTSPNLPSMSANTDMASRQWQYISGARCNKVSFSKLATESSSQSGSTFGMFTIYSSIGVVFNGLKLIKQGNFMTTSQMMYHHGVRVLGCKDVTINDLEVRGVTGLQVENSSNVLVDGFAWCPDIKHYYRPGATDPYGAKYKLPNGNDMALGVPYWFKLRGHHDILLGNPSHLYVDSPPVSLTRALVTYSSAPNAPTCKATKMTLISVVPTGTTRQLLISWSSAQNNFFYRYSIRYSTDPNFAWADGTDVGDFTGYNTYNTSSYIHTMPADGVVYYFKIRRYEDAGLLRWIEFGTFSGIADDFATNVNKQAKNYCLQSDVFDNAAWVLYPGGAAKSVTAAQENGPMSWTNTAASRSCDTITLAMGSAESGLQQAVAGLVSGTNYTAGIWLRTLTFGRNIAGFLRFGTSSQAITITPEWKFYTISNADAATTRTFAFTVDAASLVASIVYLRAVGAVVTESTRPVVCTGTTTAASASVIPFNCWNRSGSALCGVRFNGTGASQLQEEIGGIDIDIETTPAGVHGSSVYVGETPYFTPSINNMFGMFVLGLAAQQCRLLVVNTSSVEVKNVSKIGYHGNSSLMIYVTGAPGSLKMNGVVFDLDGGLGGNAFSGILESSGPVSVTLKDCDFGNILTRPNTSYGQLGGNNAGSDILFQNVRCNQSNFSVMPNQQKIVLKGVSGCGRRFMTLENQTTACHTLEDTYEGWSTGSLYQTATYDTHFFEMYHDLFSTPKTGSLDLLMTSSTLAQKPYEISGNAKFNGQGYLYFFEVGASVTWTWPHKILGVTGFQAISYHLAGSNIWFDNYWIGSTSWKALTSPNGGLASDLSFIVDCQYNISTDGVTWTGWKRASASNLSSETVSATAGFYLKLRLVAQAGLVLATPPATIAVGTVVTGATSGATGTVSEFLRLNGSNAIVIFSEYTSGAGNTHFAASETLTNGGGATTRYAMFPRSQAMYVSALRLYTTVDSTAKYPIDTVPVSVNGIVSGSRLIIKRTSDNAVLVNTQVDATSYELFTEWIDTEVRVELRNASGSPAYKPWYAIGTITGTGLSVTALQERDDV